MTVVLTGVLTGLAIIVAIGAQNAFVLRQGLRREHVGPVVTLCILSDIVLIAAAVAGLGALLDRAPWLVPGARWAGGLFLIGYGLLAGLRALRAARALRRAPAAVGAESNIGAGVDDHAAAAMTVSTGGPAYSARRAVLTIAALTYLNPHMLLDLVLLGTLANQYGPQGRWAFYAGMILASITWFLALGYGSRLLAPLFRSPRAWCWLDAAIGVTMIGLGVALIAST